MNFPRQALSHQDFVDLANQLFLVSNLTALADNPNALDKAHEISIRAEQIGKLTFNHLTAQQETLFEHTRIDTEALESLLKQMMVGQCIVTTMESLVADIDKLLGTFDH